MRLFRITAITRSQDISGAGGLYAAGRWHHRGTPVLYAAPTRSGAVLEVLVHTPKTGPKSGLSLIEYELPDTVSHDYVDMGSLPHDWARRPPLTHTQDYGTEWLKRGFALLLFVPTAVVPHSDSSEWNAIINPQHKEISHLRIKEISLFKFDSALLS